MTASGRSPAARDSGPAISTWAKPMISACTARKAINVRPYLAGSAAAAVGGAAALLLGPGLVGAVTAVGAIAGGVAFLALYAVSGQTPRNPAVAVGRPVLDFTARDDAGNRFDLARLHGRPFLLKFFRGQPRTPR